MLTENEIKQNLLDSADLFKHHMRSKEYGKAKNLYSRASNIAVGVGLDEKFIEELFGSRQEEPQVKGLFDEELVQKAFYECSVKR